MKSPHKKHAPVYCCNTVTIYLQQSATQHRVSTTSGIPSGLFLTVARELVRYKLYLVGIQEIRWDKWGTVRVGKYTFFSMERKCKSLIGYRIFCTPQRSISSYESRVYI
jgi:hypothetical protein